MPNPLLSPPRVRRPRRLKLYLVSRRRGVAGYDEFQAFVARAASPAAARQLHPNGHSMSSGHWGHTWVARPSEAVALFLGYAGGPSVKPGVVLASFNAG